MPGFDSNRFVDLSESEKNELTCSICRDILRCPVVTQCCRQSFCEQCINDWLVNNNTCPYDRKTLTNSQLSRASRIVMNMLGKLRIRCDFRDNGCDEVIVLENLSNHLRHCQYNHDITECVRCLCNNRTANHNCVEYLLDTNNKITIDANQLMARNKELVATNRNMTIELSQLKRRYNELAKKSNLIGRYNETQVYMSRQIDNLKKEKENFLQLKLSYEESHEINRKLNELKMRYDVMEKSDTSSSSGLSESNGDLLRQKNELEKENEKLRIIYEESLEINRNITMDLNHLKSSYDVMKKFDTNNSSNESNVDLLQSIEELEKEKNLVKSYKLNIDELNNRMKHILSTSGVPFLVSNNISSFTDIKVDAGNMNMSTEMRDDLVMTAQQALRKYNIDKESKQFIGYIKTEFDRKYGGSWHCIVGCIDARISCTFDYIYFAFANKEILLFKI